MDYRDGMFQMVLEDFTFREIRAAFVEFIKTKPDLPSPSDIANIINPPKQPLSAALYIDLKSRSKQGYFMYSDERAFCAAYEAQELAKVRGGSQELKEAQAKINAVKALD